MNICDAEVDGWCCTLGAGHASVHEAWGETTLYHSWASTAPRDAVYVAAVPWDLIPASAAEDGLDVLVRIWPDGTGEVAVRNGHDQRRVTWSPPVALEVAP